MGAIDTMRNGRQLKAARVLAGLTQRQLAGLAHVHANTIRYWERMSHRIGGYAVRRITDALAAYGVEVGEEVVDGRHTIVVRRQF